MNIFDALENTKDRLPNKEAILFCGTRITYKELHHRACRLSSALRAAVDLRPGDRVGLFLPNRPEFLVSYYAVVRLGSIAVSLNVMLKRDEVKFILNDCAAKLLITNGPQLDQVPAANEIPSVQKVICPNPAERDGNFCMDELTSGDRSELPTVSLHENAGAAILYTSGTTGKPKGVLLSHGNLVFNVRSTIQYTRMSDADRLICYLPLFHCFGQNFIMNAAVSSGATLILHERFQPDEILESIKSNRVSMFFGVPVVYSRLLSIPKIEEYFRDVRYCFTAAASMPTSIARLWREKVGKIIYEGYGLTETSPFAAYNHDSFYRDGSIGTPVANVEMKIIDAEGRALPGGEIGEIAIKGPNVMQGYFGRPKETAEAMRGGWFLTGDIGKMDDDGYFYLVDRSKDMINVSGFKVWPREVEEVLLQHPGLAEVAVVGIPDFETGEAVKAFAVLKPGESMTEQELIDFGRSRMAVYKAPRFVEFIDALPKNPTGKVLKRELRARGSLRSTSTRPHAA
ncbi:MAG TPA: long-chain fatty acid--CoA ligase [Candidatus Acidoferrales bacterium]|nr:long-chain fatty acid--CoA ligase [Candidatus Acidoferrales bacterium]